MGLSILTAVGLVLLKLSLNVLAPRQWTLQQTVTDAYLTGERAFAQRIPFDELLADDSPWPASPTTSTTINVEMGRLPGGVPIRGTLIRTRIADTNNYPIDGDGNNVSVGTVASNPAGMKIWRAQSVIVYKIGGRNYAKSRTVLRSQ